MNFQLNNLGPEPARAPHHAVRPGRNLHHHQRDRAPPRQRLGLGRLHARQRFAHPDAGFGTLAETMANVETFLIRHDPDPISPSGEQNPVTGTLGHRQHPPRCRSRSPVAMLRDRRARGTRASALSALRRYDTGHGRAARATAPSWRGRGSALAKRGASSIALDEAPQRDPDRRDREALRGARVAPVAERAHELARGERNARGQAAALVVIGVERVEARRGAACCSARASSRGTCPARADRRARRRAPRSGAAPGAA